MPVKVKYVPARVIAVEVRVVRPVWREFLAY